MSSSSLLHDWWFWALLVVALITGIILLACKLVIQFPGLVERRRKISREFVRKISRRGREPKHPYDEESGGGEVKDDKNIRPREKKPRRKNRGVRENVTDVDSNNPSIYNKPREFIRKLSRRDKHNPDDDVSIEVKHTTNNTDSIEEGIEDVNSSSESIPNDAVEIRNEKKLNPSSSQGPVKRSREFVRKLSSNRYKREHSNPPETMSKSSFRGSIKRSRDFVRKISESRKSKNVSVEGEDEEEGSTKEDKKSGKWQPVIRITPSVRGSLKISRDFVRKLSKRGQGRDMPKCDDKVMDCDKEVHGNDAKTRKTGVCVVYYYPPGEDEEVDFENIAVVPVDFQGEEVEDTTASNKPETRNIDMRTKLGKISSASQLLEEAC